MVKCKCCQETYQSGGKCPRCGLSRFLGEGVTEKEIRQEIDICRKNYLGNIEIYFTEYLYESSENDVSESESNLRLLARPIEMECGETIWLPEEFEDIPEIREITADIVIKRGSDDPERISVPIGSAKQGSFRKIGIMMTPGFRFRIIAGDENSYAESEENSLIGKK